MVTTIAIHASLLGDNIGKDYRTLNAIIVRHEALIRKRWLKKSARQRRDVLLQIWPDMTESHRPDHLEIAEDLKKALAKLNRDTLPSDACTWPFINLEDLTKPRSLLVFLNSRGRNVPMNFAESEVEFSPLADISPCGPEPVLENYKLYFARDSSDYGRTVNLDIDGEEIPNDENGFKMCMRPALYVLYIQERILRFLVACCSHILHDISQEQLMSAPILDEPSTSELSLRDDAGHLNFADSVAVAPYRNRGAMDFTRLRFYMESLLTNAKDHLWALREDPSYLHDTILEFADHRYEMIPDSKGRIHPSVDTKAHKKELVHKMVLEAYQMPCIWEEMVEVLQQLENVRFSTSSDRFASLMSGLRCRAASACAFLIEKVHLIALSAPNMRRLRCRGSQMKDGKEDFVVWYEPGSCRSVGEVLIRTIFDSFDAKIARFADLDHIYTTLDHLDTLIRKDETVRALMSPQLSSVLTQLSLVSECCFQYWLWQKTPISRGTDWRAKHVHEERFEDWLHNICDGPFPVHVIDPSRGKLRYPLHKAHNRSNVQAMRAAEANVDAFWDWVDTYFEKKTGVGQHDVIRRCILEGGQMRRTPPWDEPSPKELTGTVEKAEYIYQPFSRIYHRKEMQITGAFDKMSVEEKIKPKTKGTTALAIEPNDAVQQPELIDAKPRQTFSLDKRAYKAMKSLFHVATQKPVSTQRLSNGMSSSAPWSAWASLPRNCRAALGSSLLAVPQTLIAVFTSTSRIQTVPSRTSWQGALAGGWNEFMVGIATRSPWREHECGRRASDAWIEERIWIGRKKVAQV
jgi:hypothetical protein